MHECLEMRRLILLWGETEKRVRVNMLWGKTEKRVRVNMLWGETRILFALGKI